MVICQQAFFHFGADHFPLKIPFDECLFFALAPRSGFGAAISVQKLLCPKGSLSA